MVFDEIQRVPELLLAIKVAVDADPPNATHAHTLILGTTTDPITPYPAAVRAQQLVSGSILLTRNGVGHGVYGRDPGITAAADQYLLAARPSTTLGIPDR
ncbi:alpha/beta hydrolase [Nocardia terpenica]|uniref:Peptidase S33 tripeptidyl aminopeptidase-like C-terminal domain-containing protein n=1 Tax=Nocardia terpenica TaxID=455432 RepID=A0A164PD93_9NOCA|nr:alpha/beta hydrolase [Nocardia terpenica]KZM75417.1 hypothetical protein AWN90_18710 [Nocardia terpenica]NQE85879.1 hypothetical protein [Nocardia terpenica]BBE00901.1 putative peptidase [Nocardia terpenica]